MLGRATLLALVAIGTVSICQVSATPDYPKKPIQMVVPYAAGSGVDVVARVLASQLAQRLGQGVVIENRPGANTVIAAAAVARAEPDGYTMMFIGGALAGNAAFRKNLPYDALRDFAPITQVNSTYGFVLVTAASFPAKNLAELVAVAKQKPGMTYATFGRGPGPHVSGAMFAKLAGIDLTDVPYNSPALVTDVITGRVDMTWLSTVTAVPIIRSGQARAYAITGPDRSPAIPEVPTFKELGYSQFDRNGSFGLFFPAKTPPDIVQLVYEKAKESLGTPEMKKVLGEAGSFAVGSSPAEYAQFMKDDIAAQRLHMEIAGIEQQD